MAFRMVTKKYCQSRHGILELSCHIIPLANLLGMCIFQTRWDGEALQNAVLTMLVKCAFNSKYITDSVTIKAPPHHHTSSSMLHCGIQTCGDHPFTYFASHTDTAVGTKNLKFGLI